jgi:hypothetical protein
MSFFTHHFLPIICLAIFFTPFIIDDPLAGDLAGDLAGAAAGELNTLTLTLVFLLPPPPKQGIGAAFVLPKIYATLNNNSLSLVFTCER